MTTILYAFLKFEEIQTILRNSLVIHPVLDQNSRKKLGKPPDCIISEAMY